MQATFKSIFITEISNNKNVYVFSVAILSPLIITVFSYNGAIQAFFCSNIEIGENPWKYLCLSGFGWYKFLYPILTIAISLKLYTSEQKTSDIEKVLAIPNTYVYYSKAFILVFYLFISVLLTLSFILIGGELCSIYYPLINFQDYEITYLIIPFFEKLIFAVLSLIAIQLFLINCFKNVIYSIGIPLLLIILGNSFLDTEYHYLFPYSYSFEAALDFENGEGFVTDKMFYWNMLYSVFFFVFGAFIARFQKYA